MEWSLVGLGAVVTALVGLFKFLDEHSAKKNGEMLKEMDKKLDAMDARIEKGQKEDRQAITRIELITLINHDPDNVVEIEKLARYYFSPEVNGNRYMSSVLSKWSKEHNVDFNSLLSKEK